MSRGFLAFGQATCTVWTTLYPDKTRFVDFSNNRPNGTDHPETDGTSFTFLGFAYVWGNSGWVRMWCDK